MSDHSTRPAYWSDQYVGHVMLKDSTRPEKIVCQKCQVRWPCQAKVDEIMAKIKEEAKAKA